MKCKNHLLPALAMIMFTAEPSVSALESAGIQEQLEWKVVQDLQLTDPPVDAIHSLDGKFVFVLTPECEVKIYDTAGQLKGTIPVDEGVTSLDLDPLAQYLYLNNQETKKVTTLSIDFIKDISSINAPVKGSIDAPVTIAVYSDFQ